MADIRINSLPSTATSFNTDDYIAIDGASAGTRKMLAATLPLTDVTFGTSGPSAKSSIAARAARQGLVFDGTAGTTWAGFTPSSSDFTVAAWFSATSLAANNVIIDGTGPSSGFAFYVATDGSIRRLNRNAGTTETTAAGLVVTGKRYHIAYVRGAFYLNGVSVLTFTDTQNYNAALTRIGWSAGSDSFCTGFLSVLIYNRALSASEVVALYEAGAPSGADYNSASNTAINTSTAVDGVAGNNTFAATAGGSFTGASATGFTAVSGGGAYAAASFQPNFTVQPGQIIRVTYTATVNSGTVVASLMNSSVSSISASHTVTTGTRTVEFVATAASTSARVIFGSSGGGACNFSVSSVSVVRSGLLLAPDAAQAGGGLVWYDTSGNAANITLPASGVSWNVPTSGYWGGNLTVSGGTATISKSSTTTGPVLQLENTNDAIDAGGTLGRLQFYSGDDSGGGNSVRAWIDSIQTTTTPVGSALRFAVANGSNAAGEVVRIAESGNLLLKSDGIDSGNGKLQLATHTTSAGGIGFGTNMSLYKGSNGAFSFDDTSGANDTRLYLYNNGTMRGAFEAYNVASAVYVGAASAGWSTFITSGGQVTALTLDSSQNATFAGTATATRLIANSQWVAASAGTGALSATANAGVQLTGTGAVNDITLVNKNGNNVMVVPTGTTNATFAGAIAIGNTVNTVSPTSPNRTITMVIGGTTYYIHAKTTND